MADAFRFSMYYITLNLCFVILRLLSIVDGGWKVSRVWKWQHLLLLCLCRAETVFGQVRYSVQEEMAKGSFVGNIAHDLGLDVRRLKSGRARVFTEDGREYFGLNIDKGTLEVKERIDREELCGSVSPCSLHFQIILDNPMELHRIDVEILDINDHAPAFAEKEIVIPISESAIPGARFSLESAKDPDVGDNALQSYVLKPTDHFVLKLESRPDGTKYVEMLLKTALDRESQENLNLVLTAIDGGAPPKSGTIKILVNILDVNDNPPIFTKTVYKVSLQENSAKGIVFLTVRAADADTGINGEVTYSFSQSSDGVSEAFSIDPITGEISVKGNIDYERNKQYEIIVKATDQGGLTDTSKVLIDILDVNDNAPVITVMSLSSPIPENAAPDMVVAMLNIKDADSGKNGQIRCSIDADLPFRIKSTSSNFHSLVTERVLDREMVSEYNVTITATDGGSPTYSSKKTLTLKISDINDNAPQFEKQSYTAYVMENNLPGVSIYSVKADDKDSGNNAHVSYLLEDTQTNGFSVSSYISVNSETGSIHGVRTFDFEQIKEFHIRITAQDAGSPPLRGNATVHIIIQDQNDNAPQILYPVQTGGSLVAEMVPRSADVGYLVTKVVAVDVDSGQNAWLSYKLQKAADRALFEVGSQNGEIRTIRPVSDKDAMKQRLTVVVEDNGQPSRSATVNVNVMVADSFPEVLSEFSDNTHDKDYNDNLTFYLVLALAVVSFLFILSLVVIISVKIYRWRQSRIFYQSNLPVIPYYPTLYSDAGGTGTLQHMHNYEVYMTTDSRKSDTKFVRPVSPSVLMVDPNSTEIMQHTLREKNIMDETDLVYMMTDSRKSDTKYVNPCCDSSVNVDMSDIGTVLLENRVEEAASSIKNPSNTEWHFAQNQRPGPSGKNRFHTTQERSAPYGIMRAGPSPDESVVPMSGTATGPWPNPPTEAEQLQALMAAANEANEATGAHIRPGTMGRCGPQFAMQHVPDYRQNVYIPGSTATLLAASPQQALPPPQDQTPPPIQAEPPKPAQTPASKKKSAKKDKK